MFILKTTSMKKYSAQIMMAVTLAAVLGCGSRDQSTPPAKVHADRNGLS
jgi:hypothetical protein